MDASARITVTTGPNRGQMLEVTEELVHIGSSSENALVLSDALLAERQLCITRRGSRHAIFVTGTDEVEVDGTRVPPDRWVWLPQSASVQVTRRTALEFVSLLTLTEADFDGPPPDAANGTDKRSANGSSSSTKRGSKSDSKQVSKVKPARARFITDQAGDPLVKLGADGHLPDLSLMEGTAVLPQKAPGDKGASSLTLILAFAISLGLSLLMLFVDLDAPAVSASRTTVARKTIKIFYGTDDAPLEPYQQLLRKASWAHSQGDNRTERKYLRNVLNLLRAENKNLITGITRLPPETSQRVNELTNAELRTLDTSTEQFREMKNDDQLERLLSILLKN